MSRAIDDQTLRTQPDPAAVLALLRAHMRVRDVAVLLGAHERAVRALIEGSVREGWWSETEEVPSV
jgi:hypothetical protein